ncbi:hypothetical protein BCR44DRAFT_38153 [Catenaria anguillulae PL171]|uniref:Uncharacterized protein n=1 Tax=Catenaria anguillulae PL171 TaxID=765915 RepID=A0A1Y2I318_9FUNG|nr:hypothetical protein BCR44DRAFT_38153 [Catenaria anguillulae PL171]
MPPSLFARFATYALVLHVFLSLASHVFRRIAMTAVVASTTRAGEAAVPFAALSAAIVATHHLSAKIGGILRPQSTQAAVPPSIVLQPTASLVSQAKTAVYLLIQGVPAFTVVVTFAHDYGVNVARLPNLAILHMLACCFHHVFYFTHRRDAGTCAATIDRLAMSALIGRVVAAVALWVWATGLRVGGDLAFLGGDDIHRAELMARRQSVAV